MEYLKNASTLTLELLKILSKVDLTLPLRRSGKDETESLKLEAYCPHAGQISKTMRNFMNSSYINQFFEH